MAKLVKQVGVKEFFSQVRSQSHRLTEGMTSEDMQAQSMTDASPIKWHLGHTTWFFETFILKSFKKDYSPFNPEYEYLFNSYYETVGDRHPRPIRGLLTRPSIKEIWDYREYVEQHMRTLLEDALNTEVHDLTTVGLHHEMQHQELMLTDFLHLLSFNPLNPKLIEASEKAKAKNEVPLRFIHREGGIVSVGAEALGFSYDCERPAHKNYLTPFSLSNRLVNNGEWLEFINDGGYQNSLLWLSDGWALVQQNNWAAPLYWEKIDGEWFQYGLDGMQAINKTAPVCHVSYYEANAFANWAGARLPREHELEFVCVAENAQEGNFLEKGHWRPTPAKGLNDIEQLYGDVWEWTQSAYLPYPNFKAEQGALGEYNGKFMSNQMVLKGGSCVTPELQMRPSYRNFFYPHQRWQFMGFRLAKDL